MSSMGARKSGCSGSDILSIFKLLIFEIVVVAAKIIKWLRTKDIHQCTAFSIFGISAQVLDRIGLRITLSVERKTMAAGYYSLYK